MAQFVVEAEGQGYHGSVNKPLKKLGQAVKAWLEELDDEGMIESCTLHLQVNWPISNSGHSSFTGVKAITIPHVNLCGIELRIRVTEDIHRWHCLLICPSQEVAVQIISLALPENTAFYQRHAESEQACDGKLGLDSPNVPERTLAKRIIELRGVLRTIKRIQKPALHRQFCFLIGAETSGISTEIIGFALEKVLGKSLNNMLPHLVSALVRIGIITPVSKGSDDLFATTPLFEELAAREQALLREAERERVKAKIDLNTRLRTAAQKDLKIAQERCREPKDRKERLSQLIAEGKKWLAEHPFIG